MDNFTVDSLCGKCGAGGTGNSQNESKFLPLVYAQAEGHSHEVIKRTCKRCGYHYYEKPLDQ